MSIANTPTALSPADAVVFPTDEVSAEPTKRWTVAEYHELIRLGLLTEDDPYELIEGWLVRKMTKNSPHNSAVRRLNQILYTRIDANALIVDCQNSLTLIDGEPEPDIAILPAPASQYDNRNPSGSEVKLIVEVSDSTLRRDRGTKLRSYARAGIPQYWIVNLIEQQIEVYSQPNTTPEPAKYDQLVVYAGEAEIPVVVDGRELFRIPVSAILPATT